MLFIDCNELSHFLENVLRFVQFYLKEKEKSLDLFTFPVRSHKLRVQKESDESHTGLPGPLHT